MQEGHFYFIKDEYYIDFSEKGLMINKKTINEQPHNRPCFYAFRDHKTGLYWMIPLSSKLEKYKQIYHLTIQ